jgi:hypothetical protein
MQAAIDRVMQTYRMLKKLNSAEEREIRKQVTDFLTPLAGENEDRMIVEALRHLRAGDRSEDAML